MNATENNPLEKLNARQRKFVEHYCDCLVGAEAARRAGYAKTRANQSARQLLTNSDILAAISYFGEQIAMPAGEAVRRMSRWAGGTMEPFLDELGNLVLDSDEAVTHRHLIKKIKQKKTILTLPDGTLSTEYWTEIELHDAKDATDKMLQLHGRYKQLPGDLGQDKTVTVVYRTLPDGQKVRPGDKVIRTDVDPS